MVKVKLKKGLGTIGNAYFELTEGVPVDIPDHHFNPETMDLLEELPEQKSVPVNDDPFEIDHPEPPLTPVEAVSDDKEKETSFRDELIDLPGIGPKIADKILSMAPTKADLSNIPHKVLIDELRDDVVIILDGYLGRSFGLGSDKDGSQ